MTQTTANMPGASIPLPGEQGKIHRLSDAIKRGIDILAALVGMIVLTPAMLYFMYRIRRDSPGPILYRGPRMGRNGKVFHILKLRTMYEGPESYSGPKITAQGDPRITPFGRWLRDTKINELPQLWNVLVGDMSLVGPRPEDPDIAARWEEDIRREILSVRPGITSPASVLYRNEETLLKSGHLMDTYLREVLPSKLRLDQLYVRHRSLTGDIDILFWTLIVMLPRLKSFTPPEDSLLLGPFTRLMQRHASWFLIDTLISLTAMGIAGVLFRSFGPLDVGFGRAFILALFFAILFSAINMALGANRIEWSRSNAADVFDLLPGLFTATILALLLDLFYPTSLVSFLYGGELPEWVSRPFLPGAMVLIASMLASFGFVAARYRTRLLTGLANRWVALRGSDDPTRERILIIGGGETGQIAAWMMNEESYAKVYRVVGYVDDDLYKRDKRIAGVPVIGTRHQIAELVKKYDIGIIIFAIYNIRSHERKQLLEICSSTTAQVVVFPDILAALGKLRHQNGTEAPTAHGTGPTDLNAIDSRLAELEAGAAAGDLEFVKQQIQELRQDLQRSKNPTIPTSLAGLQLYTPLQEDDKQNSA